MYIDQKLKKLQQRKADYSKIAINSAAIQAHIMRKAMPPKKQKPKESNIMLTAGVSVMEQIQQIKKLEETDQSKTNAKKINYINKLTLAQRIGLVEKPQAPLTDQEWKHIEEKTMNRMTINNECPICYEKLGFASQVVLNCSHVFHKACIESYERYSSNNICPLCRKEDYEKKPFTEGMKMYIDTSIKR